MSLSVPRAVLVAALIKADQRAPDVRRDDATVFLRNISRAINKCTRTEIQNCKSFIIRYVLPSAARTAAVVKYISTATKSCKPEDVDVLSGSKNDDIEGLEGIVNGKVQQPPDPIFRRLHALYIVHDVLVFARLKLKNDPGHAGFITVDDVAIEHLQNAIPTLAQLAVCANGTATYASKEALEKVEALLSSWEKHSILPVPLTSELHASLQEASRLPFSELLANLADDEAQAALTAQREKEEASKWVVPKSHHLPHDPTAPWHELPAANGLFQRRTQGFPLRAQAFPPGGYSLQNGGRKADEVMRKEVEDLLAEAKRCFDKYTDHTEVQDIDALGNIIWKPNVNRKRRNHWGWSYENLEAKRRYTDEDDNNSD